MINSNIAMINSNLSDKTIRITSKELISQSTGFVDWRGLIPDGYVVTSISAMRKTDKVTVIIIPQGNNSYGPSYVVGTSFELCKNTTLAVDLIVEKLI